MKDLEQVAIEALGRCRLPPASWVKRFLRSIDGRTAPLTHKQRVAMWENVYKFRRQIDSGIVRHAKTIKECVCKFELALNYNPHDWECRLVYADWLEERGSIEAARGQRWQGENQKCPAFRAAGGEWTGGRMYGCNFEWYWMFGGEPEPSYYHLPDNVWATLMAWSHFQARGGREVGEELDGHGAKGWRSRLGAGWCAFDSRPWQWKS